MNTNVIPRIVIILCLLGFVKTSFGQQFNHPLFIPPLLKGPDYNLVMGITKHNFGDQYAGIRTFSYNEEEFLGPTILWYYGDSVQMHVTNHTEQESTNHWHGAHVPPIDDGGPNQPIPAGTTWSPPKWKVMDPPCTMWYHPHLHMQTLAQVNMGLAGMIIIRDPKDPLDAKIPHRYGIDDIPLIVQDRHFIKENSNYGRLVANYVIDTTCTMGHSFLVNGHIGSVLKVPAGLVRLRILDGSSERGYMFALTDSTVLEQRNGHFDEKKNTQPFQLIGTDAGYTPQPYEMRSVMMGPGERTEWLIDFSKYPAGTSLYLSNLPELLPPSIPGSRDTNSIPGCVTLNQYDSFPTPLLRIEVQAATRDMELLAMNKVPAAFHPLELDHPDPAQSTRTRYKTMVAYNPAPNTPPFSFDSTDFNDAVINDTINLGATEIWDIYNTSGVAHPFHIHDISFKIISISDPLHLRDSTDIPLHLRGPKDVVFIQDQQRVRFTASFLDFSTAPCPQNGYMYHCHILSHEDGGMMHQFVVVDPKKKYPPCTSAPKPKPSKARKSMSM